MEMPGMQMTNQHHMPSQEIPQSAMPESELLKEEAQRPPMRLKDFEDLAMANNPTLKQANDLVRRSAAQARQAGLYPNPTVGYEGSEIRGGSFGGGEEGAFIQQTIVLGGKLGLRRRVFEQQQHEERGQLRRTALSFAERRGPKILLGPCRAGDRQAPSAASENHSGCNGDGTPTC